MTVQIHTPTCNEIYQAKWNLESTGYLTNWSVHLDQGTRPLIDALKMWNFDPDAPRTAESRLSQDDYVELNPLAHVRPVPSSFKTPHPLPISLESPGDLILDDDVPVTVMYAADKDGNPVENPVTPFEPIPFNLIPPDTGIYYMVQREEIDGKSYSFYRPCHPTEKPQEGEELIRLEKPLKPIWPDILRVPPEPTISEVSVSAQGVRTPLLEGSFREATITLNGWGPKNFQFKY